MRPDNFTLLRHLDSIEKAHIMAPGQLGNNLLHKFGFRPRFGRRPPVPL
jgi:hypothetical protein